MLTNLRVLIEEHKSNVEKEKTLSRLMNSVEKSAEFNGGGGTETFYIVRTVEKT